MDTKQSTHQVQVDALEERWYGEKKYRAHMEVQVTARKGKKLAVDLGRLLVRHFDRVMEKEPEKINGKQIHIALSNGMQIQGLNVYRLNLTVYNPRTKLAVNQMVADFCRKNNIPVQSSLRVKVCV